MMVSGKALFSLLLVFPNVFGVVIIPGGDPKPYTGRAGVRAAESNGLLRESAASEFFNNSAQILMSSYTSGVINITHDDGLLPSGNSFVRGAIQAWGEHLHLVIRPEEVWFTILTQINFYMEAHAEDLRSMFVSHQGQELIYIEDKTWLMVLSRFKDEIQKRVKTDWLLDWILPQFSTTTQSDVMTANVLMMGLTKAYFRFEGGIVCGLPSVTLLGEQDDWAKLLRKLDHLKDFGTEPEEYGKRLKPILSRFVSSFDKPDADEIRDFWSKIVTATHRNLCGAAPLDISGWIAGFLYWDSNGKPTGRGQNGKVELDGVKYPSFDITKLPMGYARAPFIMRNFNGEERFPAYVASGTLGKQILQGPPPGYAAALGRVGGNTTLVSDPSSHSTIQPLSAWMLYGPVDHNATQGRWDSEDELRDIISGTRANMGSGLACGP